MSKATMRLNTQSVEESGNALASALNKWFMDTGPSDLFRNCDNCKHMVENAPAFCNRYNITPPASVIVVGCNEHDDKEEIPF